MNYTIIIGLEVHTQLLTASKLFCGCSTKFGAPPNSQTCPICIGMPGVLPVMNRRAFELSLKTAVALHCDISDFTKWDRKNYYYPDLPKNYQISQYDLPFSHDGFLDVMVPDTAGGNGCTVKKRIGIIRAHLEEDAGKLLHSESGPGDSRVDLNRTGTPLLEIVSKPDLRSPAEAKAYLEELRLLLRYLGVSDCNMQEGSLRCDANVNIHVHRDGESIATPIVEVKNMNSFRAVERAMAYEAERQFAEFQQTGKRLGEVAKATAGWDDARGVTVVMRRKEEASDYRYFPEPDLVPVVVKEAEVDAVRESLGELPAARRDRLATEYQLSDYDASVIIETGQPFADYFEEVVRVSGSAKMAANWCQQDVLRTLNDRKVTIDEFPIPADALGALIGKVVSGQINTHSAREVFVELLARSESHEERKDVAQPIGVARIGAKPLSVEAIIQEKGFSLISNEDELRKIVASVLDANPQAIADFKKGKKPEQVAGFIRGQIMKQTRGQANSNLVQQLVADELSKCTGVSQI